MFELWSQYLIVISQPRSLLGMVSKVAGIYWVSSTFYSVSTLNNFVVSQYAAQGKCRCGKLMPQYDFIA